MKISVLKEHALLPSGVEIDDYLGCLAGHQIIQQMKQ